MTAIVFDFGGVLMDWDPRYLYARIFDGDEAGMERFLSEVDFYEWNAKQDAGRPFSEAVAELTASFPHYAGLIRAYDERYLESLGEPHWGTVAILKALRELGYPLYGLSNWPAEKFALVYPIYEFFQWFDEIVISGELRLIKPDPRAFTAFLERTGRAAQECLLIDDSLANLQAAQQLGFQILHFQSPEQLAGELVRLGLLPRSLASEHEY
jgi:2-haloacid dehalogenase